MKLIASFIYIVVVALSAAPREGSAAIHNGGQAASHAHQGRMEFHGHHGIEHRALEGHHGTHHHIHRPVVIWPAPFLIPWYDYPSPLAYENAPAYVQQGANYWYYCPDPNGYYPDIQNCSKQWLLITPANPPQ